MSYSHFHGIPIGLFPFLALFTNTPSKTMKCKCKQSTVEQQNSWTSIVKKLKILETPFTILLKSGKNIFTIILQNVMSVTVK